MIVCACTSGANTTTSPDTEPATAARNDPDPASAFDVTVIVESDNVELTNATRSPSVPARAVVRGFDRHGRERIVAARELSARTRAICCLKGRATVVAHGERVYVNATGNPGMATAGSGDVLAGIVVAYLAACRSGVDPSWTTWDAVCTAVHVHGLAGDLARARYGTRGLVASDLVDGLPAAQERLRETAKLD